MPERLGITKSMSEAKNTALGGFAGLRYSHVVPATSHSPPATPMITATLILAALTLLIAMDESAGHDGRQAVPVDSDEHGTSVRR